MTNAREFVPFLPLRHPHLQTIVGGRFGLGREPPSTTRLVELPDGDRLALEVSTPAKWTEADPTVILVHGLCGCHGSTYLVRVASKLCRRGYRAVRMNMRGCGSGRGMARRLYHSGRSEDALEVVKDVHESSPRSPLALVGFSLGGNVVLKLAGELGQSAERFLTQVIAVCPPADLLACSHRFGLPFNRIYERYFVGLLLRDITDRHRRFPELGEIDLPRKLSLFEFDDRYTAPQSNFRDARHYYETCSSLPLLPSIRIPCRILYSGDDPLVDSTALDTQSLPDNIERLKTGRGGHLGFVAAPWRAGGYRWMDQVVLRWLDEEKAKN